LWTLANVTPRRNLAGEFIGYLAMHADLTERKQAEEALISTSTLLESLLAQAPLGFCLLDRDLRFVRINERLAEMNGFPVEAHLGNHVRDIVPGLLPLVEEVAARMLATGEAIPAHEFTGETPLQPGIQRFWSESWYPVKTATGEITGFAVIVEEITGRKQVEEALRESEERYRDLVRYAPAAIYEMDVQGTKFFSVNDVMCDIVGYSREELLALKPTDLMDPASMAMFGERVRRKLAGEAIDESVEYRVRRKDGEWIYVSVNVGAMTYTDETTSRVVVIGHDVTARRQAEEALRESELRERERAEELATLLDATPTPVFIVHDPEGTHITGNRAANELVQMTPGAEISLSAPADVRPRHFKAVKDGRELSTDEMPAQRAARGETVQDFECSLVFDDGAVRHVLGYGTPLRDQEGNPRGAMHVLVDITGRKQAEEALLQAERARALLAQTQVSEIGHRTKNNLAIVAGLLQMQIDRAGSARGEVDLVRDAIARIQSFAALHEQMYQSHRDTIELVDAHAAHRRNPTPFPGRGRGRADGGGRTGALPCRCGDQPLRGGQRAPDQCSQVRRRRR
jgi:PAS domain S-box-containing protein